MDKYLKREKMLNHPFLHYLCRRYMAREKTFRFKQFTVVNDRTAMKVGTDGVLLGAWCPVDGCRRVLDVGTGCGVIALMIAQRNPIAQIEAIDIDQAGIEEATLNFSHSQWSNRLRATLMDYNSMNQFDTYDLIVSNPPFFTNGVLPNGDARIQARHTISLTYHQLINRAYDLLNDSGYLALISPADVHSQIVEAAAFSSLTVRRLTRVIPVMGAAPKRLLWLLSRHPGSYQEDKLTISNSDGSFTEGYIDLTKPFYLKM